MRNDILILKKFICSSNLFNFILETNYRKISTTKDTRRARKRRRRTMSDVKECKKKARQDVKNIKRHV